jgi:hypothetical protein
VADKRRMVGVLGALASAVAATAVGVGAGTAGADPGMRPPEPVGGARSVHRPIDGVVPDDREPSGVGPAPGVDAARRSTFWL